MADVTKLNETDKKKELYTYSLARHEVDNQPEGKEVQDFYNRNAKFYDEFMRDGGCVYYTIGARELTKHLKEIKAPKDVKIADVGAGTGLVGQLLTELYGYNNLTAFDVSAGMLEEAKKKDAYNDFVMCDLHVDDMEKYQQKYDHAISIGCFVLGIVKPIALEKVASLVKPGGLVCISFREKNLDNEKAGYRPMLDELEAKGVWKEVSRVLDDYLPLDLGEDAIKGYYLVFQIC